MTKHVIISKNLDGSTHACSTEMCGGGVARNMAEALWRLRGGGVRLLTAIGDDSDGSYLSSIVPGLLLDGCKIKGAQTSMYSALFDSKGECLLGLGDMEIHNEITTELVDRHIDTIRSAPMVVIDGNIPQNTMNYILQICQSMDKPVFFEPTDRRKAVKALQITECKIHFASPNMAELRAMAAFIEPNAHIEMTSDMNEIIHLSRIVTKHVETLVITMGSEGVTSVSRIENKCDTAEDKKLRFNCYTVEVINSIENVSGAGDCFASGFIYGILSGFREPFCVSLGFEAAKSALFSKSTVPVKFTISSNVVESSYRSFIL